MLFANCQRALCVYKRNILSIQRHLVYIMQSSFSKEWKPIGERMEKSSFSDLTKIWTECTTLLTALLSRFSTRLTFIFLTNDTGIYKGAWISTNFANNQETSSIFVWVNFFRNIYLIFLFSLIANFLIQLLWIVFWERDEPFFKKL